MTSSSSTSGSGSLSSQSVPSSMESGATLPTQDIVDGYFSEPDESAEDLGWGKLIPVARGFQLIDLKKDVYTLGRDTKGDVCFAQSAFQRSSQFQSLSKKHFELIRETSDDGEHVVYIKDWSSNGTFVNGVLIGKGNKLVIESSAEISLSAATTRAYIFLDLEATQKEQETFPQEVKEKFTISRFLGRGVCGEVRLAFSKGNECNKFAIKIISKKTFSIMPSNNRRGILDEVEILKKLDHPCIVKLFDVIDTPESLFIVLELIEGGELFDRVLKEKKLEEPTAKLLFYQMLVTVKYLHDKGFSHRDLKPENVLLCSRNSSTTLIKIADFGLSKFVGEQSLMKTLCGTPSYLAPEVLAAQGTKPYHKECDCWSLGVILFVCLSGYPPFAERPASPIKQQIISGSYSFPDKYWGSVSNEAKDLIRKLLTVDPKKRISVTDALEHPWMKDEGVIKKAKMLMELASSEMAPSPADTASKRKYSSESDSSTSTKRHKSHEDTTLL